MKDHVESKVQLAHSVRLWILLLGVALHITCQMQYHGDERLSGNIWWHPPIFV
jgi:hypothetical protein